MKGQVAFLQKSFKVVEVINLQLKEEISSLTSKLNQANFKRYKLRHKILRLQQDVEHLSSQEVELIAREASSTVREVDLTANVEFLNGKVESLNNEVEIASDKVKGGGVQVGFRIFHQVALQLHLDFDIKALEALVTLEIMGQVVNEVEEEVAAQETVEPVEDPRSS